MACTRRSLTSSFTFLSRRIHPSFAHILPDDRDRAKSPQRPPPPPPPPPILSSNPTSNFSRSGFGFRFGIPIRDGRSIGFAVPMGFDPFLRSYSSSTQGSNEIGYFKDVAEVLTDTSVATTAAAAAAVPTPFPGEVAVAAADSYLPVAALQYLIDGVHSFSGLNWWAAIVLTTVLIRGATIPLLLNQMKATVKLNVMRPELEELKEQMQNSMDPQSLQEGQKRMKALFQKHGVTPFTPLKGLFIQGPVFISFFLAISNMVEKVPSFKGGGAFWFTDLTTPDPLYVLPVLTSLAFLATVELNMQEGMEGNPMARTMKNFFRVLALMTVPLTASFPKGIFCYWITSNLFSLVYGFVIKRPPVRKFLNLPDMVAQPSPAPQPNFSFFGGNSSFFGGNSSFFAGPKSIAATASPPPAKEPEQPKSRNRRASSSATISHRIRNLEKTVKSRSKPK